VTVPCLDDWEKDWTEKAESGKRKAEMPVAKLLPVDFRSLLAATAQSN
jgi:hypothetical protein